MIAAPRNGPRGLLAGLLLLTGACDRRAPAPPAHDPALGKELPILQSAIATIHERYVDEDAVQIEQLIAHSLKGMIQSVDPYAQILDDGAAAFSEVLPPDAPPVEIKPVDGEHLVSMRVFSFAPEGRRFLRGLEAAQRAAEPSGVLLDIRGAAGEDYDMAVAVAEWFLPPESVVGAVIERQGETRRVMATARRAPVWPNPRLVVLVDRETSGPAEWLAAALRFHQRAILVGEPTRGVAVIQTLVRMAPGWNVKLTTGRVLDPEGKEITGQPRPPDITAVPDPDNRENSDWIYRRGLTALRDSGWQWED